MSTRVAQAFGPILFYGPGGLESYASFGALIEASPIYQSFEVSLRIWGTRSKTVAGVTTTQTIDQTETETFTRADLITTASTNIEQTSFSPSYGGLGTGGISQATLDPGVPPLGGSASIVFEESGSAVNFLLGWSEIFYNNTGSTYTAAFDSSWRALPGLPNPKRQRLYRTGAATAYDYTFSQTVTPPGTSSSVVESFGLGTPQWGSLTAIPVGERGELFGWGYSAAESIDTSAWSETQWRDYRGTWVFPAQSMVTGDWTSGDMQRQFTVVLG